MPNEAKPRSRITRNGADLGEIYWRGLWFSLLRKRQTWVGLEDKALRGLASIRSHSDSKTWEVDYLLSASADEEFQRELLEMHGISAGQAGAERIFLRISEASPLISSVQQAGFRRCFSEFLYRYDGDGTEEIPSKTYSLGWRSKRQGDEFGVFSLYNSIASQKVCRAVGSTFKEWSEAKDLLLKNGTKGQFVYEKGGRILGWLRLAEYEGDTHVDMLVDPASEEALEMVLTHIFRSKKGKTSILCLVPEFQEALCRLLLGRGFVEVARYVILVKQVTAKVRQASLAPAGV